MDPQPNIIVDKYEIKLDELPNDLIHYIFLFLDIEDNNSFGRTCKRYYEISIREDLWTRLLSIDYENQQIKKGKTSPGVPKVGILSWNQPVNAPVEESQLFHVYHIPHPAKKLQESNCEEEFFTLGPDLNDVPFYEVKKNTSNGFLDEANYFDQIAPNNPDLMYNSYNRTEISYSGGEDYSDELTPQETGMKSPTTIPAVSMPVQHSDPDELTSSDIQFETNKASMHDILHGDIRSLIDTRKKTLFQQTKIRFKKAINW
eukprot:CAMPEP_0117420698 /NCGR_PEP_ID=MMETSP0758-20121206/1975_1 /TAXON_ID=63605 /ORGANISM="Percolomonas cosmopolitus, Strain AE-1 (ATCC 50343)" /LENGTH=258 /DNA_ID=CAMNT_0005202453 /DNA_START=64 /DNA_END=837 /DNA_ORIENTATION=-